MMKQRRNNLQKANPASRKLPKQLEVKLQNAVALHQKGCLAEAEALYLEILEKQPEHADCLHLLGVIAVQVKFYPYAIDLITEAISIYPHNADFYYHRGMALKEISRLDEAIADLDKAIDIDSKCAKAYYCRGNILHELRKFEEAISCYNKAIGINPSYADPYGNRGFSLLELNDTESAISSFDKCLSLKPNCAETLYNKSIALLLSGEFTSGWQYYEWRWENPKIGLRERNFDRPRWTGRESLQGKRILLHSEQGLGDTINFCRYAKLVAQQGAHVILESREALLKLLSSLEGVAEIFVEGDELPHFDFHCPLLSLPLCFNTEINNVPVSLAYLKAEAAKVSLWANRLGQRKKPRVGVVWRGNVNHANDSMRSIDLSRLQSYLPDHCEFISLQKELRDIDRASLENGSQIKSYAEEINDFTDTAALIELMDLVISVDTSVAHLAGALGKKTWILLPYRPDWRWLLDRTDSIWYPSVKLYRQPSIGDWSSVLECIRSDLTELSLAGTTPS